jgi:hypothetical protein
MGRLTCRDAIVGIDPEALEAIQSNQSKEAQRGAGEALQFPCFGDCRLIRMASGGFRIGWIAFDRPVFE